MSKVESGFIPLPKVEQAQPLDNLLIELNLPQVVDQDRIGINVSRIDSLCRLSGIEALAIIGTTGEETSKTIPQIVGMNPDGSAVASKSIAKTTVPTSKRLQIAFKHVDNMSLRNTQLNVFVNIDEISQTAAESKSGIREPKVWSENLDKELRTSLRKAGTENLIKYWDPYSKLMYKLGPIFVAGIVEGNDLISNSAFTVDEYMFYLVTVSLVGRLWDTFSNYKDPHFRWSVFVGPQFDRAAVLQVKTRTQKLVKDLGVQAK